MTQKFKVTLFLGPQDGLTMYLADIDSEYICFTIDSFERVFNPDFSKNEYHTYQLDIKNGNEFRYSYIGVSVVE